SPDGSKVAWITAAGFHVESLFSSAQGTPVDLRSRRRAGIVALALVDADSMAAFYDDHELEMRDIVHDRLVALKHLDVTEPATLVVNGQYVAAYSSGSGDAFVFDVGNGEKCSLIEHHKYPKDALSLALSPLGRFAVGMRETLEQQGRSLPSPGPV